MLEELRTFLAVSAAGSIHGATRTVPLTQSAITRQMQRLESQLNCELFDRSMKPPRLTRAGERALLLGRMLLEQVEVFREGFGPGAVPTGLLRVGVAHAFLDWNRGRLIAEAIGRFAATFNRVTLRLSAGWTPSLITELEQGGLDAAIVIARPGISWPSQVNVTAIGGDQLVAVAPRRFGLASSTMFEELFEHPWILNPDGCGYRSLVTTLAARHGRTLRIAAEVHGAELHHRLIAAGLGVGLVPLRVARYWKSLERSRVGLTVIKPAGDPFVIKAALIANARSKIFSGPIDWIATRLRGTFAEDR